MEGDAVDGEVVVAPQLPDQCRGVGKAGAHGVSVGDRRRIDLGDVVDLDHHPADDPVAGAVAVPGDDLASLPAPEREGDGPVGDQGPEPGLEQHARSLRLLNRVG